MNIEFQDIYVTLGHQEILHGISLTGKHGQMTGIVGANGCGKSTLMKSLFGIVPVKKGSILLDGTNCHAMTKKELSALVGYVSQEVPCMFDFTVREIVEMGLYARRHYRKDGKKLVQQAIAELQIEHLSERSILTLSGGERKMAFLARAVAQGVDTIILDEPTNHLDIRHQLYIMNFLRNSGKTVITVLHDLSLATHYCDTIYLMCSGNCLAYGSPEETLTKRNIQTAFGVLGEASRNGKGVVEFKLNMDGDCPSILSE
ncbi:MAG: ABC transporter ATP-binding protein [Lachnospiraceae bacterium]